MSDQHKTDGEPVGYCRPPTHSRFKPGHSGNPSGRPKRKFEFGLDFAEELSAPCPNKGESYFREIVKVLKAAAVAGDCKTGIALLDRLFKLCQHENADPGAAADDDFVEKLTAKSDSTPDPEAAK
jgi:Family of unknown function (DUF5681)